MSVSKSLSWNALPQFIWGEAHDESEADELSASVFLTHTRYPRFACEVIEHDYCRDPITAFEMSATGLREDFKIELSCGLTLQKFAFVNGYPDFDDLKKIMLPLVANFKLWSDALDAIDQSLED